MRFLLLASFLVTALASCNTYDPKLGATPFKCGASNPRCPDDYTCVETSPGVELCVSDSANPGSFVDGGTPGAFTCNDDVELEPNDMAQNATPTGIPAQPTQNLVGLAICPPTDIDVFKFDVSPGAMVTVTVAVDVGTGDGPLAVDLLNSSGTSIAMAMPDPMDPSHLVASASQVPQGTYYVRVKSDGVGQNNYNINISTGI